MRTLQILMMFVVLSMGCEDQGRIGPTRGAESISVIAENGPGMDDAVLCDGGRPVRCIGRMALQYHYFDGTPIDMPGLRMEPGEETSMYFLADEYGHGYWCDTHQTGIDGGCVTGEDGFLRVFGWRNFTPFNPYRHNSSREWKKPGDGSVSTIATISTQNYQDCREWPSPVYVPWATYGYYYCEHCGHTHLFVGGYRRSSTTDTNNPYAYLYSPDPVRPSPSLSGYTPNEHAFLNEPAGDLPDSGIEVVAVNLIQQRGTGGVGYAKEVEPIAFNDINPESIMRYASPMMYSYRFLTADPVDLSGQIVSYKAKVKTDACPSGKIVDVSVIASNAEKTAHVARTGYFIPIDADLYDPSLTNIKVYDRWTPIEDPNDPANYFEFTGRRSWDPNGIEIVSILDTSDPNFITNNILQPERLNDTMLIPIFSEGDYIRIEFVVEQKTPLNLIDYWLSDNKTLDSNADGIVNLGDL